MLWFHAGWARSSSSRHARDHQPVFALHRKAVDRENDLLLANAEEAAIFHDQMRLVVPVNHDLLYFPKAVATQIVTSMPRRSEAATGRARPACVVSGVTKSVCWSVLGGLIDAVDSVSAIGGEDPVWLALPVLPATFLLGLQITGVQLALTNSRVGTLLLVCLTCHLFEANPRLRPAPD